MTTALLEAADWPTGDMPALQMSAPGQLEVTRVPVPGVAAGTVLCRVLRVGICGTDVHLLSGHSAYVVGGLTEYPIRFGHEWAGVVVAAAPDVDPGWVGRTVVGEPFLSCGQCRVCRAGHYNLCPTRDEIGVRGDVPGAAAEYFRVPITNIAAVRDGILPEHALLAEPSVTVLNAYQTAAVQPGERVAVIGTGAIGLIAAQVGVGIGCDVDVLGIDPAGLDAARSFGATATSTQDAADGTYDVVIEASGAAVVAPDLTRIAAIGGRILQVGIPGRPADGLDLAAFVTKGLTLAGVLGGVHLLPRALELIARQVIRPELLLDEVVPVAEAVDAFVRCAAPGRARPKVVLDMTTLGAAEAKPLIMAGRA